MKVVRPLRITSDEFFDYLEEGIERDLLLVHADEEDYEPEPLAAGLTYVKNPDERYLRTEVEILAYERGRIYQSHSVSFNDDVVVTYEVEPTKEGIKVTFTQMSESIEEKRRTQNVLMRGFSDAIHLGRMGESLVTLQYKLIDAREGTQKQPGVEELQQQRNQQRLEHLAEIQERRAAKRARKSQ